MAAIYYKCGCVDRQLLLVKNTKYHDAMHSRGDVSTNSVRGSMLASRMRDSPVMFRYLT